MSTTIYDSSLLTMRKKATVESGSFISRISPWNVPPAGSSATPTTGYAPTLGIYDQSIINTLKNGNMTYYRKNEGGCTTVMKGCPCDPNSS